MLKRYVVMAMLASMPTLLAAQDKNAGAKKDGNEAKELSGMSIVGNNEAPKSLYIVPWKGSELGAETDLRANLLDDRTRPVDKEVFMRALDYYELSNQN